jgi:hypothetical protein
MAPSPRIDAAESGRADALATDARLRSEEMNERAERLTAVEREDASRASDYRPPADVARLAARLEELTAFRKAVLDSLVWRTAQGLRRLLGREW